MYTRAAGCCLWYLKGDGKSHVQYLDVSLCVPNVDVSGHGYDLLPYYTLVDTSWFAAIFS